MALCDALKRWKRAGYASLPACWLSIGGRYQKPGTLEAMRTQGFPQESFMSFTTTPRNLEN